MPVGSLLAFLIWLRNSVEYQTGSSDCLLPHHSFTELSAKGINRSNQILISTSDSGKCLGKHFGISGLIQLVREPTPAVTLWAWSSPWVSPECRLWVLDHFLFTFEASLVYSSDTNVFTSHHVSPAILVTLQGKLSARKRKTCMAKIIMGSFLSCIMLYVLYQACS